MREQVLKSPFIWLIGFVAVIWAVELMNTVLGHDLDTLGILPRTASGLVGIPLSPILHGGFGHVTVNTVPFLFLGGLVAIQGRRALLESSLVVVLLGGAGVWLAARGSYHIGASGLIFGYFGYLVARGWYERSILSIGSAIVTVIVYGSIVWGLLPTLTGVSWEGHLFGLLAGVVAARLTRRSSKESQDEAPKH